jgi:hypothetical protein
VKATHGIELDSNEVEETESTEFSLGVDGATYKSKDAEGELAVSANAGGVTVSQEQKDDTGSTTKTEAGLDLSGGGGAKSSIEVESADGSTEGVEGSAKLTADEDGSLTGMSSTAGASTKNADGATTKVEARGTVSTDEVAAGGTLGTGQDNTCPTKRLCPIWKS